MLYLSFCLFCNSYDIVPLMIFSVIYLVRFLFYHHIEELIISFRNSQIKEMMDFGNTLVKWKYEIVNSFVPANGRRISNGLIENRNKSIKLLKHSSNGYLNWHRFKTRIMYSLNKDSTYHLYPIKNKGDFTE